MRIGGGEKQGVVGTPRTPTFGEQRQEDLDFEASLG